MTVKHNKLYYEQGRNGYTPSNTWQKEVIEDKDNKWSGGEINPKMLLNKEDLMKHDPLFDKELKEKVKENYTGVKNHHRIVKADVDYGKDKIPNYYIGKVYGYEARKVIEDFDLSYNIGTATTYLLRAKRKHSTSVECIQKAINHLEFELDKIKNEETDI